MVLHLSRTWGWMSQNHRILFLVLQAIHWMERECVLILCLWKREGENGEVELFRAVGSNGLWKQGAAGGGGGNGERQFLQWKKRSHPCLVCSFIASVAHSHMAPVGLFRSIVHWVRRQLPLLPNQGGKGGGELVEMNRQTEMGASRQSPAWNNSFSGPHRGACPELQLTSDHRRTWCFLFSV